MNVTGEEILPKVLSEFRDLAQEMAELRGELKGFNRTLEIIVRIVQGEGGPSLINTVTRLDTELTHVARTLSSIETRLEDRDHRVDRRMDDIRRGIQADLKTIEDKVEDTRRDDRIGKYTFWGAVVASVVAFISTIVSACVAFFR